MTNKIYRFDIGAYEGIALKDGSLEVPATFLFTNAPQAALHQTLEQHDLHPDRIAASISCLLVNTGQHLILFDTGMGPGHDPASGNLSKNLADIGIEPEDIDWVVLSHGHPDHIGGNTETSGQPAFPKARYVMWRAEWEYWTTAANQATIEQSWIAITRKNLHAIRDRFELIERDTEILPGVQLVASPGHTPGHLAMMISPNGARLMCAGDALGHPVTLEHPDWLVASDTWPEQVETTRRQLLSRAVADNALVFSNHFVFPGLGHVVPLADAWQWRPLVSVEQVRP